MEAGTINDMSLGDNIRALRERRGMRPKELATLLGISVQAVSQWERDKTSPALHHRTILCELFGVTLEELASRRLPLGSVETGVNQTGEEMVEKNLSLSAIRVAISILRPDLPLVDAQALAAVFLSLALTPSDPAIGASYEDQLRARFQGALAARSAEK